MNIYIHMEIHKLLLMMMVIFLLFIVISYLLQKRQTILNMGTKPTTIEGMGPKDDAKASKNRFPPVKIKNVSPSTQKLPLRELCIKSSYACPWSGSYISTDMIKVILSRGYRYLDIPIYYGGDSNPYVFYSNDTNSIDPNNTIPLDNVFKTIAASAFSNVCPNPADPLFIELRITPDTNGNIYDSIASLINSNFLQRMYVDSQNRAVIIDGSTPLLSLMGKIIFFMNISKDDNFASKNQNFAFLMNAIVGNDVFMLKTYRNVKQNKQKNYKVTDYGLPPKTDIKQHTTIMPEVTESHSIPNIYNTVLEHGCQILVIPFYQNDGMVQLYENVFDDQESAFIPMASMLINGEYYFSNKNPRKSQISYGAF
jgi:hypothetical protein